MSYKVLVKGLGAWSPLGRNWINTWKHLLAGASHLSSFEDLNLGLDVPVSVADCQGLDRSLAEEGLLIGASLRLAKEACQEALGTEKFSKPLRLYGGTTHGESDILVSAVLGKKGINKSYFQSLITDSTPELLARDLKCISVEWVYSSCVSGTHALLNAWLDIKDKTGESALVVGSDALSVIGVAGFNRLGVASKTTCRPFQSTRDGTTVGEGAAAVLLESSNNAKEDSICLLSFGTSCDAGHPTSPDPEGKGLQKAIEFALQSAKLKPSDIGAIYLHGTGTINNDSSEALAYQRIFGDIKPPATSLKGLLGHSMGATGLMSCLAAVETSKTGLIPPTLLKGELNPMNVNVVTGKARQLEKGIKVLVQVSAFGGNNTVFVLGTNK